MLQGKVTDSETGEPILFGNVAIFEKGKVLTGTQTDFDGNYKIIIPFIATTEDRMIDVEFSYVGYNTNRVTGLILQKEKVNRLDITLGDDAVIFFCGPIISYNLAIISADDFSKGQTLTNDQIRRLAVRRN